MSRSATIDPTQSYRREARRLRARLALRPGELYKSLRELSAQRDLSAHPWQSEGEATSEPKLGRKPELGRSLALPLHELPLPGGSARFADRVAQELEEGVLRYSSRMQLLSMAESMRIGRFQANLIIAAVQHQSERSAPQSEPAHFGWIWGTVTVVLLQALIIACAYALFLSH